MDTRIDAEACQLDDADDLRVRASRIRARSAELIAELGPEHPLVARAVNKARVLDLQASALAPIR